ncbi:type I secretion system permease/ATPase [Rhizobium mesosinicum]|uniref:Type I secretion system permease/ATPase n=1 Tax=Rhizobium mesosinicum TaxID=335017 RepID=A0ABS7H116_9HYPH|nr:type I secretion system permease/ATPase [Rhizobium mesosinicum]MBW9055968.1 type I secretion system permease/ATPase [Rhizobium mesosinicum]
MNNVIAGFIRQPKKDPGSEAFSRCKSALVAIALASAVVNILYLTGSFFMLQVYDRVIPSRSVPSLIALSLLALLLYIFQGGFEVMRSRMLVRVSGVFDEVLSARVFRAVMKAPVKTKVEGDGLQMLRDFDQVRSFLSSSGPAAFLDLPWMPLYIAICFMFHPIIGIIAIAGALVLIALTFLTHRSAQTSSKQATELGNRRNTFLQAAQRNAEVVQAMGMRKDLAERWLDQNNAYRMTSRTASDTGNVYSTISKIFRAVLQSAVLATGAVLVIENQASGGIIIASSILTSRSLAPVEQAIANWRGFVAAQQAWGRLRGAFRDLPENDSPLKLRAPYRQLTVEQLVSGPPGKQEITISGVSFSINAGSAVGVIGPSASGKSSLARAVTGIWPSYRGSVRLDGATLDQWDDGDLGAHIGYLPQDIELFSGTVAENISRFQHAPEATAVIAAAEIAGVHEMILRLPKGYETQIGPSGSMLSAGQRQRIALARALYKDPFLVVLDEPNSNLDREGEAALAEAILSVRRRGGIVFIVAHRPSALEGCDLVLMMSDGKLAAFGPKDEVLARILRRDIKPIHADRSPTLKVVGDTQEQ